MTGARASAQPDDKDLVVVEKKNCVSGLFAKWILEVAMV